VDARAGRQNAPAAEAPDMRGRDVVRFFATWLSLTLMDFALAAWGGVAPWQPGMNSIAAIGLTILLAIREERT